MKKLSILVFLCVTGLVMMAQMVEKTYHFDNPVLSKTMGYDVINFDGCMQNAEAGCPSLPWQSVSLLLPKGMESASIKIEFSDFQEIEGNYNLFPKQMEMPYSQSEKFVFFKNKDVYSSNEIYPSNAEGNLSTSYKNGYGFAFSAFTPVRYVPATGKVRFAKTVTVKVSAVASKADHSEMLWGTQNVRESVERLAQNPEMMASYDTRDVVFNGYDILVITGQQYVEGFAEYKSYYDSIGWRTRIATVEDIYSSMEGRDNQEKIRNYVIQEYQTNGISTLILGGDIDIVPYRGFYCYVSDEYLEEGRNIPADLYYAGLDGTWNDNNDDKWGEIGEDDLLPEIGVARLPFNNSTQQDNMIHKTLSYQQSPVLGEFRHVTLGGEWMSDAGPTYGSQYMNMVIGYHDEHGYATTGIPENYIFNTVYEENGANIGPDLMAAINLGGQYTHHAGHANSNYVAGWFNWDITDSNFSQVDGVTHNYTFFHSHGCIAGAFDDDCIMERMVTIENFCVAAIGNSRYGWFTAGTTDGPSAHLHREMTDAQYTEKMPNLALALMEAKIQTAPWVNSLGGENSALRWNFYDLNILGDGAVATWLSEPVNVNIVCDDVIQLGASSMEVTVNNTLGAKFEHFRCTVFSGEQLIGFGITNEDGIATVTFAEPVSQVEELRLVVTGQNAWPKVKTISTEMLEEPFVIYDSHEINAENGLNYGETVTVDVVVKNYGAATVQNAIVTLSCDDEFVEILNSEAMISSVGSLESYEIQDAFEVRVSNNVPDQHEILFTLTITEGEETWTSSFKETANAPQFEMLDVVVDDGGDGKLQPGESAVLHFTVGNIGHSGADNISFTINNPHEMITSGEGQFEIGACEAGGDFTVDFEVTLSPDIEEGANYELTTCVTDGLLYQYGSYAIAVGHSVEDFETGDFTAFDWQNDEDHPWSIVTENPHEGQYCAKSAPIGDNLKSVLVIEIDVYSDDQVVFYKKVSSEAGWDKFFFYVDGDMMGDWSGDINWSRSAYDITCGHHILKWMYSKDGATTSGEDCAWLDNITLPPTTTITNVDSYSVDDFDIYPNPNNGIFVLNMPEDSNIVTICNTLGQVVYRNEDAGRMVNVNLSGNGSGLYLININGVTKKTIIK